MERAPKTKNDKIWYILLAKNGTKLYSVNFDGERSIVTETVEGSVDDIYCGGD